MGFTVQSRIEELLAERGWSTYRMALTCGLSQSAISNILKRGTCPSVPTLLTICQGLGITIAEFFEPLLGKGDLTPEEDALLQSWRTLPPDKKAALFPVLLGLLDACRT